MTLTNLDDDLFSLLLWAIKAHGNQPYGDNDYGIHLVAVLCIALEHGVTDWDTLAACICHDLLEDTTVGPEELAMCTNETVVSLVRQCTFTQATRSQQLEAIARSSLEMTPRAMIVKCCDTIANMGCLGAGLSPQKAVNHKWMKTRPYRLRFVRNYRDRISNLGRPLRPAETAAYSLAMKIRDHLLEIGVTDA